MDFGTGVKWGNWLKSFFIPKKFVYIYSADDLLALQINLQLFWVNVFIWMLIIWSLVLSDWIVLQDFLVCKSEHSCSTSGGRILEWPNEYVAWRVTVTLGQLSPWKGWIGKKNQEFLKRYQGYYYYYYLFVCFPLKKHFCLVLLILDSFGSTAWNFQV